ncbi:MAG: acetylornithine deacetylase [Paracoccaceae bacterium]
MTSQRLSPFDIMCHLVAFPTISKDSNLPLIDWVETYLRSHHIIPHRCYNDEKDKAALFAHVGPEAAGGVVLSGHSDVVPIAGQLWEQDPWTVLQKDNRYYGRGTCDMKGFVALAIWALVEARYADLQKPLQLALSYDEEVGCLGAPSMIEAMRESLPFAERVIVGEPSMMQTVTGHKGGIGFETHVSGFEVHSSLIDQGVSAIMSGAKLIDWANDVNAENRAKSASEIALMFDPPYTTAHVGMISGGTAHNITAKDCWFSMDFRVVADEQEADWTEKYKAAARALEAEMQAIRPEAAIRLTQRFYVPALRPEPTALAETLARQLTGDNETHVVSYGTEAGQFQQAGYSAVICGPGDIAQAHQPNEYIEIAQFDKGHQFMRDLLTMLKKG